MPTLNIDTHGPMPEQGYLHPKYAHSLAEWGKPRRLDGSGGWILIRTIDSCPSQHDAMHCYPLFLCRDWSRLEDDLDQLGEDLVTLVVVADPFAEISPLALSRCFPDRCDAFKTHYVVDLSDPRWKTRIRRSHMRHARKSLSDAEISLCDDPLAYHDAWAELHGFLAKRHRLTGIHRSSSLAFRAQLDTPGMVMFRAELAGTVVGADLWYVVGDVAYGHLAAYSEVGYRLRVSYGLLWTALQYFSGSLRWVDLGGVAGATPQRSSGLSDFKQGWSNARKPAYLCGRIFDRKRYQRLCALSATPNSAYFPAYRSGEFSTSVTARKNA